MRWRAILVLFLALASFHLLPAPGDLATLHGRVIDERGPVAGARVRWQGADSFVLSDRIGRFRIDRSRSGRPLTASRSGYRIAAVEPAHASRLTLARLPASDNEDYHWLDPFPDPAKPHNCANCHGAIFDEWRGSSHARAASNPRYLELIDGRDAHGELFATWNLRREHPLGVGVCATCHVPTQADTDLPYEPRRVPGVAARGVHCDYCHKIVDAPTDKLGTRFGRDGLRLLRPADSDALFFGPLDDAVRAGESFGYLPLYKESRYCASCHEGIIFGVPVYGTYSEWLASPAAAKGQQCQTCHMTPTGRMSNIAPGKGGSERRPQSLASHHFPGSQADMLRGCLHLDLAVSTSADGVRATATVTAENVGHRVPTGFIDRNLVLVVEARDADGRIVALQEGPTLPPPAGKSIAGLPGLLFAKRLVSLEGKSPLPFWLPHEEIRDTRLYPGKLRSAAFLFPSQTSSIHARVVYRRFWPDLAAARGWADNEIVVWEKQWNR